MGDLIIKPADEGHLKLQNDAGTTAIEIKDDENAVYISGDLVPSTPLSHRNMIINGAMQVAQRGTGFSAVTATGYQIDRFETTLQGLGAYTITQNTTAPTSEGFTQTYKIDCTSADASPSATDFLFISHKIEGQNLQHLRKGTSDAKSVTLSFWCRCTKTGNIQVNLNDWDNTRIIGQAVTISSADTWEKKTLTFAGDTSGVLGNDNGASLVLEWWLDKGSNFSGGAVPTSWEALSSADRAAGCTLAFGDNAANDFYITGVQLELGSVVATPFEHRSYADELRRCQRYYYKPETGTNAYLGKGHMYASGTIRLLVPHPVTMRTTSTTLEQDYGSQHFYGIETSSTATYVDANWAVQLQGTNATLISTGSASTMTVGRGIDVKLSESTAYIAISAEL